MRRRRAISGPYQTPSLDRRKFLAKKLTSHRVGYTKDDIRQLKELMKAKTPMAKIGKTMGRTATAVSQKAYNLGVKRPSR
jgi:hypothetical protein